MGGGEGLKAYVRERIGAEAAPSEGMHLAGRGMLAQACTGSKNFLYFFGPDLSRCYVECSILTYFFSQG